MKDGKRKLLAADTAELRQTWMDLLLNAMQSPGYVHPDPACTWQEEAELRSSGRDSTRSSSGSEGERGRQDSRPSSELWDTPTLTPGPHTADPPPSEASNPSQPAEESFDSGLWRSSMEPERRRTGKLKRVITTCSHPGHLIIAL
ncbi:hypothetical protein AGOR_G00222750 [Albula goreensis]|uniref:PH domain-containing protein n=1 Tax=Albula goreensis TaxID=1534307 RepID=A0A8T3CMU6_9TELE|nr:hypothetical protein AGOR_G00222750 [Albula goreensis]